MFRQSLLCHHHQLEYLLEDWCSETWRVCCMARSTKAILDAHGGAELEDMSGFMYYIWLYHDVTLSHGCLFLILKF